ncbi:amidohydrolase family protein [Actinomycetospora sp. NBRC 106378]|uniref:amidohydrolase family protein n=1 Tax=Actinomycetospora sp. NBRC 106378 TaxID=3032208 RepID=UPI002554F5D0|nr:amidohydrolase family protein [Actinomycetospora sp. NBRC 106378]
MTTRPVVEFDTSTPVIDSHQHVMLPVQDQIDALDEAGIDKAVLIIARPHPERASDLAGFQREMAVLSRATSGGSDGDEPLRAAMSEQRAALHAHPDRFLGFGPVPVAGASDIDRWVDEEVAGHGFRGIGELVPVPDRGEEIEPVVRAASDHGLPVLVHGYAPQTLADIRAFAEIARRHPGAPVIIGQLGGANWLTAIEAARDVPNLYLDISTPQLAFGPLLAMQECPEKTLFASDAPYDDMVSIRVLAERMIARTRCGSELRARILGGTLLSLLAD